MYKTAVTLYFCCNGGIIYKIDLRVAYTESTSVLTEVSLYPWIGSSGFPMHSPLKTSFSGTTFEPSRGYVHLSIASDGLKKPQK